MVEIEKFRASTKSVFDNEVLGALLDELEAGFLEGVPLGHEDVDLLFDFGHLGDGVVVLNLEADANVGLAVVLVIDLALLGVDVGDLDLLLGSEDGVGDGGDELVVDGLPLVDDVGGGGLGVAGAALHAEVAGLEEDTVLGLLALNDLLGESVHLLVNHGHGVVYPPLVSHGLKLAVVDGIHNHGGILGGELGLLDSGSGAEDSGEDESVLHKIIL